jgi:stress-induced morphogen
MENQTENQNPLTKLSVVELKSLAYDNLTRIQQAQSNLQLLNQEIDKRIQAFQQSQQAPQAPQAPQDVPTVV